MNKSKNYTGLIYSDKYLEHDNGNHIENKERLIAIKKTVESACCSENFIWLEPRSATFDEIAYIHEEFYIKEIEETCKSLSGRALYFLDADTPVCKESYETALLAAGGVLVGIDKLMNNEVETFFAFVRPPGHHSERDRAMGFCLFNNIAIGARYAQIKHKLEKILILDWDVHHGNGTQHSFENDPSVFFISFHQYPHYPGTGQAEEIGSDKGTGYTLNFPMTYGAEDNDYLYLTEKVVMSVIEKFAPDLILISAGFDAHKLDPLSGIDLTEESYIGILDLVAKAKPENTKIGLILEGGYNLNSLSSSVIAILEYLGGYRNAEIFDYSPSDYTINLQKKIVKTHPFCK